ncbi:carboxypeptidase-like regulatory domain-containing protein [uncultured Tenacibaculum sp.]|uniref:carboxypeptidase-like regulatory domain-containing protein n=1 Tax=uncultured Tenacibaculum sp. TaxID=174713 RepID=UPI00262956F3|nr:carboxypeptidase-like regulatory domain-containing protein [uncultured Tenacibaculum sp.]
MRIGIFVFIVLFFTANSFSQSIIKGKVTTLKNEPLEGASVYLNNTTIGTTTNEKGEFQLKNHKGNYELIVSFIGFKTIQLNINTNTKTKPLLCKLKPDTNILNEVVIQKTKYDDDWKYNLSLFKKAFLGKTELASQCLILNPKVLHFDFDKKTNKLSAYASKPLQIKHKGLGYLIYYDLVEFSLINNRILFSGYTKYQNLNITIKSKWKTNRLKAYNGSRMHFYRSIIKDELDIAGFKINQLQKVLNPERPHDSIINEAKLKLASKPNFNNFKKLPTFHSNKLNLFNKKIRSSLVRRMLTKETHFTKKFKIKFSKEEINKIINGPFHVRKDSKGLYYATPKTKLYDKETDSLSFIARKEHLKKYINKPVKKNLILDDFIIKKGTAFYLSFPYLLEINYLNEPEEDNYRFGKAKLDYQQSFISLINTKETPISKKGVLIEPFTVLHEGYWGYEAFANMLPLDYRPLNK